MHIKYQGYENDKHIWKHLKEIEDQKSQYIPHVKYAVQIDGGGIEKMKRH